MGKRKQNSIAVQTAQSQNNPKNHGVNVTWYGKFSDTFATSPSMTEIDGLWKRKVRSVERL
ncbi:hypothetical protein POX_d04841 [Penicillium oxalicum]|uniref:hypothetical protein n=1 Tax=Penicillium oxalicum TaxID=69781 RepID=UPI0020B75C32|nr:hypothetical protein POX_d04841 [Penicillium oxalicum]KAI2789353.1 hypothetical protein POX_d04841 [Penicillium oxalicum]